MVAGQGRIRLTDVAEHAGVSTATVSRVLNGKREVAEQTRKAVLTALDVLGYERPERLRRRANGLVGVLVSELSNPVFAAFAQAIESGLSGAGYTPVIGTQSPGGTTEDEFVETMLGHEVDGMIFVSGLHADSRADTARYHRLRDLEVPFVLVNGSDGRVEAPALSTDDVSSMDMAVRHLTSQGHQRIGLAIGPERFIPAQRKLQGFRTAMSRHLQQDEAPAISTLFTVEGGQAAAMSLFEQGCTAVICGSDLMALGAIRAARTKGLSVPGDVSVVGYDDSPLMGFTDPALTTLRQPVDVMSKSAVDSLIAAITGESVATSELQFVAELIVRASTGIAPDAVRDRSPATPAS